MDGVICKVPGCAGFRRKYRGKVIASMCTTHTSRKQRHGGTEAYSKKSGPPVGWNGRGRVGTNGYMWVNFWGKRVMVHHLVYLIEHGELPRGKHIHHIDGDKYNNNPDNLVALTPKEHSAAHRG